MMRMWNKFLVGGLVLVFATAAQAMEPFDNWANPPGWYGVVYPAYFSADEFMDNNGDVQLSNLDIKQTGVVLRTAYYQAEPVSWLFSSYLPILQMKATNPFGQKEKSSGIGDVTLVGGWFFVDDKPKNLYVGLGFKLDLPTGDFDKNRMIANLGEDVWRFRPMFTFAKLAGPVDLEAHLTYKIETENSDTKLRDGNEIVLESYAGMFLSRQSLFGLHFNATRGENDENNGTEVMDSGDRYYQFGPSFLFMPNQKSSLMLEYLKDFAVKNAPKGTLILGRFAYKF
jgi:hypothetical protein